MTKDTPAKEHPASTSGERSEPAEQSGDAGEAKRSPEPVVYEVGGRKFDTVEGLVAYTRELSSFSGRQSNQIGELKAKVGELESQAKPEGNTGGDSASYSERLYQDPDGVLNEIMERAAKRGEEAAVERIRKEAKVQEDARLLWESFYSSNPDLRGHEFVVNGVFNSAADSLGHLSTADAMDRIATTARQYLSKHGALGNKGAEDVEGGDTTVEGSSDSEPAKKGKEEPKFSSFIDELKELRPGKRV